VAQDEPKVSVGGLLEHVILGYITENEARNKESTKGSNAHAKKEKEACRELRRRSIESK
jgi:hypothetical protein